MNKAINFLRKQSGYISIETIVVAGLIIGIGAITISKFRETSEGVVDNAISKVENALDTATTAPPSR